MQETLNSTRAEAAMQTDTRIYLDNAATTALDPEVVEAMMPYLTRHFGNPSSTYSFGRETRLAIEQSRKTVARILGTRPANIFFTSGGTESNNTAIATSIRDLGCNHIISSPIEHHAVLHTVEHYANGQDVSHEMVKLDPQGTVDLPDLELKLKKAAEASKTVLVSLMHANNEIGVLLPITEVGELCRRHGAYFHSDCVQTVGHYDLNLSTIPVDFISGAGHKFHGPKGVGILYIGDRVNIKPFIFGGGQERNMRAGTENVYGIVGFAKALEIAQRDHDKDVDHIKGLKKQMIAGLADLQGVSFNCAEDGLYTVLSVCFPRNDRTEFLLMNLDINHICASGGSACSSGADAGSHVMKALGKSAEHVTIRFSFSKFNTSEEIDRAVATVRELIA